VVFANGAAGAKRKTSAKLGHRHSFVEGKTALVHGGKQTPGLMEGGPIELVGGKHLTLAFERVLQLNRLSRFNWVGGSPYCGRAFCSAGRTGGGGPELLKNPGRRAVGQFIWRAGRGGLHLRAGGLVLALGNRGRPFNRSLGPGEGWSCQRGLSDFLSFGGWSRSPCPCWVGVILWHSVPVEHRASFFAGCWFYLFLNFSFLLFCYVILVAPGRKKPVAG